MTGYTCDKCGGYYQGPHECPAYYLQGYEPPPVTDMEVVLAQPTIVTCKCGTIMHTRLGTFPSHDCRLAYRLTLKEKLRGQKVVKKATVTQ